MAEILALPFRLLGAAAFEPLFTGPLLLALVRGSPGVQQSLLRPFDNNVLATNRAARLSYAIYALKWLFGLGLASRINKALNAWALNRFAVQRTGAPWKFGDGRTDEIVVVTGGCSGFGHLIVKGLAGKCRVVVVDVLDLPADLQRLSNVEYFQCDLTSTSALTETCAAIRSTVGHPTVLVNNAGIGTSHTILETTPEFLEKIFKVNLLSHWTLIREFLPAMLDARKGHVVTMASMASYVTASNLTDYCATKAGVLALHEGLNQELLHRYNNGRTINTTIVHPFWARTAIIKDWEKALDAAKEPVMAPEQVTDRVVAQVLSGKSSQLFVPDMMVAYSSLKGWPSWLQELGRGLTQKATVPGRK